MSAQNTHSIFSELGFRYDPADLYQQVISLVLDAAETMDLPRHLQLMMAQPKNEVIVHFPVQLDDGSYRLYKGYRVQHNNILGPYKGGMRYHRDVSLEHIKALAVLMTMKTALMRLPLGGGKGGVQVDPHSLSVGELMRCTRRLTSALHDNIGPEHDILAPDVGTHAQVMAWMADTYINLSGGKARSQGQAVVTGKPLAFAGIGGREKATGQGLVFVLDQLLPECGLEIQNLNYSVLGYGNVGSWVARLLAQRGACLRAVMDHTGAVACERGLDAEKLAGHVERTGGVCGFADAQPISETEFYQQSVDLFVPAALEQMIDLEQARLLDCKVIAEGANAPTTPAAERLLQERGVTVLPAVLCNCGGVTVSYFEWRQNRQAETWSERRVDRELRRQIMAAARRVQDLAKKCGCDLRTAAYRSALEHIAQVYHTRGIFP